MSSTAGEMPHMLRTQAVEAWRKERGWHKLGRLDFKARKCLSQGPAKNKTMVKKCKKISSLR